MTMKLRKNSKFASRPDLIEALRKGVMSQKEIASELGVTPAYISKFKKKLDTKGFAFDGPFQKQLLDANKQFLDALVEDSIISVKDFESTIEDLITITTALVLEIDSSKVDYREPAWYSVKLSAMKLLVQQWQIKLELYGQLSEVKTVAEIEHLKERMEETTTFLEKHDPDLIPKYFKFLDEVKEEDHNGEQDNG